MLLRDYQSKAVRELKLLLLTRRQVLAVGPTGSGKTVIACHIVGSQKGRTLWLVHRIELVRQAVKELEALGLSVGILSGPEKRNLERPVLVSTIDTFRNVERPGDFGLVVIDEAHRAASASYQKVLAKLPRARVLGLTATPMRYSGRPLSDVFGEDDRSLYVISTPIELICDGVLAKPMCYGIPRERMIEIRRQLKRDTITDSMSKYLRQTVLVGNVVEDCQKRAPKAPTLVFAADRKHGQALRAAFTAAGRRTAYVDGLTAAEVRERAVSDLASGEIEVLVNVDVFSEGFDCPAVKCVVLARPTASPVRYLQQVGRGMRQFKGRSCFILDHAGNVARFGLPQKMWQWSLSQTPKVGGVSEASEPCRQCIECGAECDAADLTCSACGATLPRTQREVLEAQEELELLQMNLAQRAGLEANIRKAAAANGKGEQWVQDILTKAS